MNARWLLGWGVVGFLASIPLILWLQPPPLIALLMGAASVVPGQVAGAVIHGRRHPQILLDHALTELENAKAQLPDEMRP